MDQTDYNYQHNKIEPKQLSKEITNFWRQINQKHENQISLEWNTEYSLLCKILIATFMQ